MAATKDPNDHGILSPEQKRALLAGLGPDRPERSQERMESIDDDWLSPDQRAEAVWNLLVILLKDEENADPQFIFKGTMFWDLLCFAVHFIGNAALGLEDPNFVQLARALNGFLYTSHYSNPMGTLGGPDKVERTQFWVEKITEVRQWRGESIDLMLCESEHLAMRAGVTYRFIVDEKCKRCQEIHALNTEGTTT